MRFCYFCLLLLGLNSAQGQDFFDVSIHQYAEPDHLNPVTASGGSNHPVMHHIFGQLLAYHPSRLTLMPQLAKNRPIITNIKSGTYAGGMSLAYEIRAQAVWDDGSAVTGHDFVFTLKTIFNPHIASSIIQSQFAFIDSILIDEENPRRFTIYSKSPHFLAESVTGELLLLQETYYDPEQILRLYPLHRLLHPADKRELMEEQPLMRFAQQFQTDSTDSFRVSGCGAYSIGEWAHGTEIILMRKPDWWGDKVEMDGDSAFQAHPLRLFYKTIPYYDAAVLALINNDIDVMSGLKPQTFIDMQQDEALSQRFELLHPDQLAYYYVAFNLKNPKFADKTVRLAFAHLLDRNAIIDSLFYGMASKAYSPISPDKPHYQKALQDVPFSVETAAKLLDKAGWKDTDKDGIRDKNIGGQRIRLSVEYKYNKGNALRKTIGEMLQIQAAKVGIDIQLVEREWAALLQDMQQRDFELCCLAWIQGHGLDDMRQIWHSASDTPDGSNRTGFASPKADQLIERIEQELDEVQRTHYYQQLQTLLCEEHPYIFLVVPHECIAVNKRLGNVQGTALRPGYQSAHFTRNQ